MTRKIRTKLLAILAVTALAIVPVFALLDSDGSSADGSHDVSVSNWGEFKTTMNNARDNPGDTYNVTMNVPPESGGITMMESITIPANVTLTIPGENVLSLLEGDVGGAKITVINEGNIIMDPHGSPFGNAGGIYAAGNNMTFINRNTITAETSSSCYRVRSLHRPLAEMRPALPRTPENWRRVLGDLSDAARFFTTR